MAGGNWSAQNKVRPGAYINFKSVPAPLTQVGSRGIMTMPVPMSWGPAGEVIELYSTDLVDGKSLEKIGYVATDAESLIFREALKNCYKALIYRIDAGGTKATATLGGLTAVAKYPGVVGNKISIVIIANGDKFDVVTLFNGVEKDRQTVATAQELEDNAWVDWSGEGALAANAGVPLSTGTNGTVLDENYTDYFNVIQNHVWNTMAVPTTEATIPPLVLNFIKMMRDDMGKKVQAVVYNYPAADYEGIISVSQGYTTATETVSPATFVAYVAGMTAGAAVNQSNTYHVITGATGIVNEIAEQDIAEKLQGGELVVSRRRDGVIVIEQDINTLHNFTAEKGYIFSKNRVIRCLDEIANTITLTFQKNYLGKVDNDETGRNIFKSDIIAFINSLVSLGAVTDFNGVDDVMVSAGDSIDSIVVDLGIKPVDSMEKLYMTVLVG